ncbi:uncharacterized protein LOC110844249 [Folsomia candida]|uniref:uncharacterized protein LOC110844249 n=1 Tax=Folsomia candida TaxID=158441 RepID=UPI000B903734|nr:uncharacterized protein LOC110844249 [Folsomia candida]XP_021946096.1 uncharacterized protein LOC110844249 [Folsomia candida]XP_021946098.1 uncharacterized protein LOC110844249 [Folsomia candida]
MVLLLDLLGVLFISGVINEQAEDEAGLGRAQNRVKNGFKYYSNRKGSRVLEVDQENRCHVFDNGHAEWLHRTRPGQIATLNYIQFELILEKCDLDTRKRGVDVNETTRGQFRDENDLNRDIFMNMLNESRSSGGDGGGGGGGFLSDFHSQVMLFNESDVSIFMDEKNNSTDNSNSSSSSGSPLIFPGTKWCGRGDIARSSDDIGIYAETDKCCREHDHCPENIVARTARYGLENKGDYTRSHCSCDEKFLRCLEKDRSIISALTSFKIANLYFNILQPECFDRRHPTVACRERRLSGDCISYQYDFQQPAAYQFFPAQPYILRQAKKLYNSILYRNSNVDLARVLPTGVPLPDLTLLKQGAASIPGEIGSIGTSAGQAFTNILGKRDR